MMWCDGCAEIKWNILREKELFIDHILLTHLLHLKIMFWPLVTRKRVPVTSLGHQEGEEFSERGPNFLNYV